MRDIHPVLRITVVVLAIQQIITAHVRPVMPEQPRGNVHCQDRAQNKSQALQDAKCTTLMVVLRFRK